MENNGPKPSKMASKAIILHTCGLQVVPNSSSRAGSKAAVKHGSDLQKATVEKDILGCLLVGRCVSLVFVTLGFKV